MLKMIKRIALFGLIGLFALGLPSAQDNQTGDPHATGLIPLDAREIELIASTWPRITRVGVNHLGFERVNEVRARKGKPALDPLSVEPVGDEVRGVLPGRAASVLAAAANEDLAADLPVSVDNSQLRFFPPIRSQGSLGACVSFAITYYQQSYMTAFQRNLDIRDSGNANKYSPKWTYNMVNGGSDSGSSFYQTYNMLERNGAATWQEFPYDSNFRAWCLDPAVWRNALGVRTKAIQYVNNASTATGLELIKELLVDGYIVVYGTYISSWVFMTASDDPSTSDDDAAAGQAVGYWLNGSNGGHAMTIVGFNDAVWTDINTDGIIDAGEKGAFRIANSWGTGWREGGFTWLAYDALRNPSAVPGAPSGGRVAAFQGDQVYVLTARNGYAPLMIGEFTVNHAKRGQMRLTLGRSNTAATVPAETWFPAALLSQGGAYAFDGSTTAVPATFVLDFTDLLAAGAGLQRYYLGINDGTAGDPTTLSAFKIVDMTTDPDAEAASSLVPQTIDAQQGYAYVDYAYAGPAANDPPTLSSPQVNPATGRPGVMYTFTVRYTDQDGNVPSVKNVVIDGTPHAMSLVSGQPPANGVYSYAMTLSLGSHTFYFYFEDGHGESALAPLAGEMRGPEVYTHVLSSLSPSGAATGDPAFTLALTGTDFMSGVVVTWDGSDRPTTFVSSTRLDAQIGAADLASGKIVPVAVRDTGGWNSNIMSFTVNNPLPSLTSVSPASASAGGTGLALTLRGTGFVPGSLGRVNGIGKTTTYVGETEVQVALSAQDLEGGGEFEVTVDNPAPSGGISAGLTFVVSDITMSAAPTELSASAGQSATCAVEVTPRYGAFTSAVSFSATGLPRGCTATFSPSTVTPGDAAASTTLTLSTRVRQSSPAAAAIQPAGPIPLALGLLFLAAAVLAWILSRDRTLRGSTARRRLATAALVLLVIGLAGCGAGGTNEPQDLGTPAGTYGVMVHATSGGLSAETPVTLVVR